MINTDIFFEPIRHPERAWDPARIGEVETTIPAELLSERRFLLRVDNHALVARWFLEGIYDFGRCTQWGFAEFYEVASKATAVLLPELPQDERIQLGKALARTASIERDRRNAAEVKSSISLDIRRSLLVASGRPPRCWVCGGAFSTDEVQRFLTGKRPQGAKLPAYVDFLRQRGLKAQDFRIEIDHVYPAVKGGLAGENLKLACGWCNRYKSANVTIYDVSTETRRVLHHPHLGDVTIPQPFWIIRLLAMRRRCEAVEGCDKTTANSELLISPRFTHGSANPVSMRVYCREHDPLRHHRLIPRHLLSAGA